MTDTTIVCLPRIAGHTTRTFGVCVGNTTVPLVEYWYDRHTRSWVIEPTDDAREFYRGVGAMYCHRASEAQAIAENMALDIYERMVNTPR